MKKIIIIGCPGSGKTTFANKLGERLDIPVYHLDKLFWKKNFKATPQDEFRKKVKDIMRADKWILDGNLKRSVSDRIEEADTVILFDFSKFVILWRVFKRKIKYHNKIRPDMGGKNKESIKWLHLKYIITYPMKNYREEITSLSANKRLIILRKPKDAINFLNGI